jgi:hypothetical protein
MCLLALKHLLGRISNKDFILLLASPNVGVGTIEGSNVKCEEVFFLRGGFRCTGETTKGNKRA